MCSLLFLTLTNNISRNKLFQTENVTCYYSWFDDKSTNLKFMLLVYDYFTIYSQNWKDLSLKSLNVAMFWTEDRVVS